jgi:DNA-binding NtrC family response regulator
LLVALDKMNCRVALAFSVAEAKGILMRGVPVACTCAELPDGNYRSILSVVQSHRLKTRVLVISETQECAEYLQAMHAGAFDLLPAPYQRSEVERIIRGALESSQRDTRSTHAQGEKPWPTP